MEHKHFSEGGYGKVFKATDRLSSSRVVAVKVINLDKVNEEKAVAEVKMQQLLDHPHIVKIIDTFKIGRLFYIVQEFIPGGELFDVVIDNGSISEHKSALMFEQLLKAVKHCHSRGVTHRDIKLENILLDEHEHLKLIDFGLAHLSQSCDGSERLVNVCGSRSYAAPEVLSREGYLGPAADVWSCGICLFAMLTGFFPFDEARPSDWRWSGLMKAHRNNKNLSITHHIYSYYRRKCTLSNDAVWLLDQMLAPDPRARITVDQILGCAWLQAAARLRQTASATNKRKESLQQARGYEQVYVEDGPVYEEDLVYRDITVDELGQSFNEYHEPEEDLYMDEMEGVMWRGMDNSLQESLQESQQESQQNDHDASNDASNDVAALLMPQRQQAVSNLS